MSTGLERASKLVGACCALWLVREDLETHPGGDTTQILQTKAALERLGVSIRRATRLGPMVEHSHLVHLFHLDRLWEHLPVCRQLRAAGVPVVLSTIYWPPDEFDRGGRAGFQGVLARTLGSRTHQTLRVLQRSALHSVRHRSLGGWDRRLLGFRSAARYLLESVRVILPNSAAERALIDEQFGVRRPAVIVPNAADASVFWPVESRAAGQRAGVLCVGRIEPRKNQLTLIAALRGSEIPLTLVGQPGRYSRRYARRCRRAAGPNVHFLDQRPPDPLRELYRAARAHACVSWYETPGLASLEAALCGCNLVVTPGGCTKEYFGDEAFYARPDDPESIRRAIDAALAAPPSDTLLRRVRTEFTWDAAARATLRGYELALESTCAAGRS